MGITEFKIPCQHCQDHFVCKNIGNCLVVISVGPSAVEPDPDDDGFTMNDETMNDEIVDEKDYDILWTQ